MLINVDTAMAALYVSFIVLTSFDQYPYSYMSGPIIGVALNVFGTKNTRDLEMDERAPQFRKLEGFLKKLKIEIRLGGRVLTKIVHSLVPNAGRYVFSNQDGVPITIEVG